MTLMTAQTKKKTVTIDRVPSASKGVASRSSYRKARNNALLTQEAVVNRCMKEKFPSGSLSMLASHRLEDRQRNYGGIFHTLNFPTRSHHLESGSESKIGKLSIGNRFETDNKIDAADGRTRCLVSHHHDVFLGSVTFSLRLTMRRRQILADNSARDLFLEYLRVTAINGARTLPHTDSLRSVTPNFIIFHDNGGELKNDKTVQFKCSLVLLRGRLFIPHVRYCPLQLSELYGVEAANNQPVHPPEDGISAPLKVRRYVVPAACLDELITCALLPFAVVGTKKGLLQVIDLTESCYPRVYSFLSEVKTLSWNDAWRSSQTLPTPQGIIIT
jgi:hypothetical protein